MAHKVLAKDMSELVSAMKLAQQYSDTTLDLEYRKLVAVNMHALFAKKENTY